MIVHIPLAAMRKAIKHMREDLKVEKIGFFGVNREYVVDWYPAMNVSPNPAVGAEIDAQWIAELILNQAIHPVAMMHSHPSGDYWPSDHVRGDYDQFPTMYVDVAFVWTAHIPNQVTQYTATKELHFLPIDEVFVHVV